MRTWPLLLLAGSLLTGLFGVGLDAAAPPSERRQPFVFEDVGEKSGLLPHAAGIRGHAAAWGDVDGDGWPDLFVGTFHNNGSKPGMLLRNVKGKFTLDKQEHL